LRFFSGGGFDNEAIFLQRYPDHSEEVVIHLPILPPVLAVGANEAVAGTNFRSCPKVDWNQPKSPQSLLASFVGSKFFGLQGSIVHQFISISA